jgi:hypothetical protein
MSDFLFPAYMDLAAGGGEVGDCTLGRNHLSISLENLQRHFQGRPSIDPSFLEQLEMRLRIRSVERKE